MLDRLGLSVVGKKSEDIFGVTVSIEIKYRKPVPYDETLIRKRIGKKALKVHSCMHRAV